MPQAITKQSPSYSISTSPRSVRRSTNKEGITVGITRDTSTGVSAVLVAPVRERRERSVSGADDYPFAFRAEENRIFKEHFRAVRPA